MTETAPLDAGIGSPRGMISVEEAREYLLARAHPVTDVEQVALMRCRGRVLAEPQCAGCDVPGFDNSSMDGIAVRSTDAVASRVTLTISQRIAAGAGGESLAAGEAARIFTGAPLPPNADAVVMQEDCAFEGDHVSFEGPVPAGQHVRPRGNNIQQGNEILSAGTRIRPQEMGLAAAVGVATLPVFRRFKVAFFSSGNELIEPGDSLGYGQIYNSNRYTLKGLLEGLDCEVVDLGIVEDEMQATVERLRDAAADADLVISSGGVSVGEEDHIKNAVESIGQLDLWKVAVKPGKPLAYGRIGEADFLGLPGNPVSTLVTFCLFARPFILCRQGMRQVHPVMVPVRADFDWPEPMRRREYLRARLQVADGGDLCVSIYPKQGSDVLSSTVWADGLVEIPERSTVARGDRVLYLSFGDLLN